MDNDKKKSIAIIGGGLAGISTAYQLSLKGYEDITIFETKDKLSGLVLTHKTSDNIEIENFYHHIFATDKFILGMIKKFSLDNKLFFKKVITSHLIENKIYTLGSLKSLFLTNLFKPFSKIRFVLAVALIKYSPLPGFFSKNQSAVNFSKRFFGKSIHKSIWLPLLKKKFSSSYNLVSSSWLISRIRCRSIQLGYLEGSFTILINKFIEILNKSGVKIRFNCEVKSVSILEDKKINLLTSKKEFMKDIVIFCCPQNIASKIIDKKNKNLAVDFFEYLSATCVIIYLDKKPFKDYWINYCDDDNKALALINHSVFLNQSNIKSFPVYVAYYHNKKDPLFFEENREKLIQDGIRTLEKVCLLRGNKVPNYNKEKIRIFTANNAQPIIRPCTSNIENTEYHEQCVHPNKNLPIFFSNMHCVYPEDRGQNFSIKYSILTSEMVDQYLKN